MKASTISFKFVALKTPFTLNSMLTTFPKKLYFTFKFFTFQTASTKTAAASSVLDGGNVIRIFDIDPSLREGLEDDDLDDHMQLAKYLKERVMTIDLWNGDSLMHFGTCKVPLYAFLRQGEVSRVVA